MKVVLNVLIQDVVIQDVVNMTYIVNIDAYGYLKTLESGSVDIILTDPPYLISRKSGFKNVGEKGVDRFAIDIDFGSWDNISEEKYNKLLDNVFKECYRVLKDTGVIVVWYDLWKLESLKEIMKQASNNKFRMFRCIEWVKINPVPINSKRFYLTNARECAIVSVKGSKPNFKSEYHDGIFKLPIHRDGGKRIHPTQKPVELMKQLIKLHTNKGEIILDPFSGSGTTVLAAYLCERKGIGCELDSNYCDKANKRLIEILGDLEAKPIWDY